MNYSGLFLDVDGTLIPSKGCVSTKNKKAIHKALQNKKYITIASGRCKPMTMALSKELGLTQQEKSYSISLNGAHIIDNHTGSTLFMEPLPLDLSLLLYEKARSLRIDSHFYSENLLFYGHFDKKTTEFYKKNGCICEILGDHVTSMSETPLKYILICKHHELLQQYKEEMLPLTNGILSAEFSTVHSLEYTSIHASKGLGLKKVCEYLNIPIGESIAMGDGENDLSMLGVAGLSLAPSNALELIKNTVDIVLAKSCDENAVEQAIDDYLLKT